MSETRAAFRVTGVVQGVGFRQWTRRVGSELGLRGAVANLRDGAVEVHATGAPHAIARLEERLAEGPLGAQVDAVRRIEDSSLSIPDHGFVIQR
jgi:acylphosphatase